MNGSAPSPVARPRISGIDLLRRRGAGVGDLLVFAVVTKIATFAAARKKLRDDRGWECDETSRTLHASKLPATGRQASGRHGRQDGQRGQDPCWTQ